MANITTTECKVYSDTTGSKQVGTTITIQGSPSTINLNSTTLGLNLTAGSQYSVCVRCTNDEGYTTDWTALYPFKTLILATLTDLQGGVGVLSPSISCTYTNGVVSVSDVGVYVSTNASGANAVKCSGHDEQNVGQGWDITGLLENTTYYVVPYVVDDLGREYVDDWANADTANTGYAAPTVTISNVAYTYNSISGNVLVSTNDTLSRVKLSILPTGGGGSYQYKTLTATTGTQSWSVTDGDLDDSGNAITVSPSTEYRIQIEAVNTSGGTGSAQTTVTTAAQASSTISITGVTNITPNSATVGLSYGSGN